MLTSSLMDHESGDGDNDESYAVDILINTLQREGAAQSSDTEQGPGKVRNGKGRVSFEAKKQSPHQTFPMENKSVRTSLVIPNLPVNKAHQTLLGTHLLSFLLSLFLQFLRSLPPAPVIALLQRLFHHFQVQLNFVLVPLDLAFLPPRFLLSFYFYQNILFQILLSLIKGILPKIKLDYLKLSQIN